MDPLDGLNPEQRRAAEAVRGPVCILAGAGSGKTTTITRRIAQQVAAGAFAPAQIMAVTFTDKAAGELKARLAALGVAGVRASHLPLRGAAPAPPLRAGRGRADPAVEGARAPPDRELAAGAVQVPARRRPRDRDRVGEEPPDPAGTATTDREPPIPLDLMQRVYREYERRKAAEGADRLRGPARADGAAVRGERRGARDVPRAVPGVHRRRVPGREPAPAGAARPVARRPRRPLRRRRRLPVDLRLHGREPRYLLAMPQRFPHARRRPARGELPLDAAGARAREQARAEPRRRGEVAAADAARTAPSRSCARSPTPEDEGAAIVARAPRTRAARSRRWRSSPARTRA